MALSLMARMEDIDVSESSETRTLCRELEAVGAITLPYIGHEFGVNGWPDRWICHPLWTGWCEFKIGEGALAPLQIRRLREIWKRNPGGAVAYWHDKKVFLIMDQHHTEVPLIIREGEERKAVRFLWTLAKVRKDAMV